MVGQDHITKTLRNQIMANRVGHAYLLNGVRGTGKTSTAKILARAINCLNPKDGEPCNECEICKAALNGSLTDIVEMDAASNNSVEDIRQIREEVNFLPTLAKYRVYIIDEVHMLSTGAFNALLKTLEEPPEHVKFILATTEPQKLPATILSRCQRFDFKKIPESDIIRRIKIVCQESNIVITDEAIKIIATLSEGALRDALSILERCVQEGEDEVNADRVKELVGIPKLEEIHKIVQNVIQYQPEECILDITSVLEEGKEATNLLWEIIKYLRDILLYQTTGNKGIHSEQEVNRIKEIISEASKDRIIQLIYSLSKLENDLKWSSQKTIMLQAGMLRMCCRTESYGIQELEKRIEVVENKLNSGDFIPTTNLNYKSQENEKAKENSLEKNSIKISPIKKTDIKPNEDWKAIVSNFKTNGKIMLYTNLINSRIRELNDMTIGIEFPNGLTAFGETVLERPENKSEIEKQLSLLYGKEMKMKILDLKKKIEDTDKKNAIENLAQEMNIPINIIEE